MHRLLIIAVASLGCQGKPTPDSKPATDAAPRQVESPKNDRPPTEIVTKRLPIGRPVTMSKLTPTFMEVAVAARGESMCVDRVLSDEDRVIATSSPDCFRKPKGLKWSLYATGTGSKLVTFDRFLDYSDEHDTITVKGGGPEETKNLTATLPDGSTMARSVSTSRLTTFVSLSDGSTRHVEGDIGDDHYHFVEGRKEVVITGYEPPFGVRERDFRVGIATGIPEKRPTLQTSTTVSPRDGVTWDASREMYLFRGSECQRATLSKDGSKLVCEVNIPIELSNNGRLFSDWFLSSKSGDQPLAINLKTGDQSNPAAGLCDKPFFPHISHDHKEPHLLIACTGEGRRAYEATTLFLWSPTARLEITDGPWNAGGGKGDFVEWYKLGLIGPARGESRWLDLNRSVMWDVGDHYLAGRYVATDHSPLQNEVRKKVFHIDASTPELRPLAELDCPRNLQVVYEDEEVISLACMKKKVEGEGCGEKKGGTPIDYVVTWDLRTGKQLRSDVPLIGATKNTLLYADSQFLGSRNIPCDSDKLLSVAR